MALANTFIRYMVKKKIVSKSYALEWKGSALLSCAWNLLSAPVFYSHYDPVSFKRGG